MKMLLYLKKWMIDVMSPLHDATIKRRFKPKHNQQIRMGNIVLYLTPENGGIRLISEENNVMLPDQRNMDVLVPVIESNFKEVCSHYKSMLAQSDETVDAAVLNEVCLKIMLNYLRQYNSWLKMYLKQRNRSLQFEKKDFDHSSTHDIIFFYLKSKYPNEWKAKCAALIGISLTKLDAYYVNREGYYNK